MTDNEDQRQLDYEQLIEKASPALRLYIRRLEQENARLRQELLELRESSGRRQRAAGLTRGGGSTSAAQVATVRHPDDVMVITITSSGQAKRTPLNQYATQRRGGVGIYDIQAGREDAVAHLQVARSSASLLVLTDRGRAFRVGIETLPLTEPRGRGTSLPGRLALTDDEVMAAVLALDDEDETRTTVLVATANGWVRALHRNYVGPRLQPGTLLFDPRRGGGPPACMTLSRGQGDVVLALRSGVGIRFEERHVRRDGVLGIQVRPDDRPVGIASLAADDDLLLITADGKGTRRQMAGFRANKSPGAQGKALIKAEALAGMAAISQNDDVLCVTGFSKIIRFAANEVSPTGGAVQGVAVMDSRGDSVTAVAVIPPPPSSS